MNTTDTNVSEAYVPVSLRLETYIVPILFGFIFIVGIAGNGTLIYIVLRNKSMRNVPNIYIVSLSLGDFILILISVPFTSFIYTFESWPYGEPVCKFNEFLQAMSLGVSVFTLTALSIDRFIAIVAPMSKVTGSNMGTVVASCAIWLLSILLAIPDGYFSYLLLIEHKGGETIAICWPYASKWDVYPKAHTMCKFVIFFLLPLLIITIFYSMMARHLMMTTVNMPGESFKSAQNSQGARQSEARKKVARMVLFFVVIFVICWAPRHVFMIWYHYNPLSEVLYNDFWHGFRIAGFCLSFMNSCINPIALYFLSKQFRKYYNRYLFCCCTSSPDHKRELSSTAMHNYTSTVRKNSVTQYTVVKSDAV